MESGLTASQALDKLRLFGKNEIILKHRFSITALFLSQFTTVLNGILASAAILSFFIADITDSVFIFSILLLNGLFGFMQEYRAEKSLEKLKSFITPLSRVIRDGKQVQIPTDLVVPGDLVVLGEGDRVPADGKLTLSHHIEADESVLTGESLPVIKKQDDQLSSATLVTKGRGHLLVEQTGMNTRFGQIAQTLSTIETDQTPLQVRLNKLGKNLSLLAIVAAFLLVPVGMTQGKSLIPLLLLAISVGIAAIPEGLPAVITISLALGTSRMAKKHAIVRKMQAVETLGAVQVILTDKTGTLTQNNMQVKKHWTHDAKSLPLLVKACVLGNTATLIEKANGPTGKWEAVGDKTDAALLLWAKSQHLDGWEKKGKIVDEYVFDPATKTVTTIWQQDSKQYVFVRGAPEEILENSRLSKTEKEKIANLLTEYAKEGLRVIGFGTKTETHFKSKDRDHLEDNLTFLGIVGIYDPPRLEAKKAVLDAKNAGIQVVMVTGDNEITATAIAKETGLIEHDQDVVTGDELARISDEELSKILDKTRVFARTKPEDKLRLVSLFKKKGYVVGVTGDGVNDALALKRSDVGIAMGESGTDVAKEASDIILTDDNFSTLVKAVEEGRNIYNNIVQSIMYLLSGNLAEISLVFFGTLLGMPAPLLPTQILWINLVTDGLPALALASDTKHPNILAQKPRDPNDPILTKDRLVFIAIVGFGMAIGLLGIFALLLGRVNEEVARTIVFNLLIFFHLGIVFLVRKKSPFRFNKFFVFSFFVTLILQVLITTVPIFQNIFHLQLP